MRKLLLLGVLTATLFPAAAAAAPTARFTWTPANPTQHQPVAFDGTSSSCDAPCTYNWTDPADGQAYSTATGFSFTFNGTGIRTVSLRVTNRYGQSSSVTHSFAVLPAPPAGTDADDDGVPDSTDQCPGTPAGAHVDEDGCPITTPPPPPPLGFPTPQTTGTTPGVPRATVNGNVHLDTPGQVYQDKTVTGEIYVEAPNVTIRNVRVVKTHYWAVDARQSIGNTGGLTIQDSELDLDGDVEGYGLVGENYTALRLFVHDGADGGYLTRNGTWRDSYIALGPDRDNDGEPDASFGCPDGPHYDGLSSDGGSGYTIDHNTILNPCGQTSAILMSTNSGAISNVRITNNLLDGGGYTLYCAATPPSISNETVTGNRFGRTYHPRGGYYGPTTGCGASGVVAYSDNAWADTGQPIPR
jgi:hypothetical protein